MADKKVPKGALHFVDPTQKANIFESSEGKEQLDMVVYSGGVIKDHWWWDDLALDLKGVKFSQNKFPVLEDHMLSKKIGFSKKPIVDGNIRLDPATTEFVDSEESLNFRKFSKQGFPYQASLYGRPLRVQRLGEKEEAEVNGFKLKGPASIWREWEYKEASVTVFGHDDKTRAKAFSHEETEEIDYLEEGGGGKNSEEDVKLSKTLEGGEQPMDKKELKEKHPELFSEIMEDGKKLGKEEAETQFSQERQGFQTQVTDLSTKLSSQQDQINKMDKDLTLSREVQMKTEADKIFSEKFSDCDIEPRLESKVRNQINHQKFVKDDKLDVEGFSKAVEEEIKDWESKMPSSGVRGFSEEGDDVDDGEEHKFTEGDKSVVKDLLNRAGQKTE